MEWDGKCGANFCGVNSENSPITLSSRKMCAQNPIMDSEKLSSSSSLHRSESACTMIKLHLCRLPGRTRRQNWWWSEEKAFHSRNFLRKFFFDGESVEKSLMKRNSIKNVFHRFFAFNYRVTAFKKLSWRKIMIWIALAGVSSKFRALESFVRFEKVIEVCVWCVSALRSFQEHFSTKKTFYAFYGVVSYLHSSTTINIKVEKCEKKWKTVSRSGNDTLLTLMLHILFYSFYLLAFSLLFDEKLFYELFWVSQIILSSHLLINI
jgi:hypothetical protein